MFTFWNRRDKRVLFEKIDILTDVEIHKLKVEEKLAKGIAALRVSLDALEAAVRDLPGRIPGEADLSAEISRVDAATAALNAIDPAPVPVP